MARVIGIDSDTGTITRSVYTDNGYGGLKETGQSETHTITCRISYESGGVWKNGVYEEGSRLDATPFVVADANADIKEGDRLLWRGHTYMVMAVTRPNLDGGAVVTQAPLTEIQN
jgi:hypothetical protein